MNVYQTSAEESPNPYIIEQDVEPAPAEKKDAVSYMVRRNAAILESSHTEEDVLSTVARNFHSDPDATILSSLTVAQTARAEGIDSYVKDVLQNPSADALVTLPYTAEAKEGIRQTYVPDRFEELAVTDAALDVDERILRQRAADDTLIRIAGEEFKEQGILDKVADFGEGFVPFIASMSNEAAKATEALTGEEASYFTSSQGLLSMRRMWSKMSPSQKELAAPTIMAVITEAVDNNKLLAIEFAEAMTLPESALMDKNFTLDKIIDGMDVTALLGGFTKLIKGANAVKRLRTLNNNDDAAKVSAIISRDSSGEAAKAAGLTKGEAAGNEVPFNHEQMFVGMSDGMAADIKNFNKLMDEAAVEGAADVDVARSARVANRLQELERNPQVTNIDYRPQDGVVEFVVQKEGAEPLVKTMPLDRVDEWNVLHTTKLGKINANVSSPATKFKDDYSTVVSLPTTAQQLVHKSFRQYRTVLNDYNKSFKKLDKDDKGLVNATLMEGDAKQVTYTVDQLRSKGLTSEEGIASYYKARLINDYAHMIKSRQLKERYNFEGFDKAMHVEGGTAVAAREVTSLSGIQARSVWKEADGTSVPLSTIKETDLTDNALVRFRGPSQMRDEQAYTYALVPRKDLRSLQASDILPRREGYVTNVHEKAKYFVTEPVRGTVDGVADTLMHTRVDRAFSTKKKMDEWVATAREEDGSLKFPEGLEAKGWSSHFDREFDTLSKHEAMREFNGLFTGKRSQNGLIVDGVPDSDLANPFDAAATYYQDLARRGILDTYRTELKQRWLNTYRPQLDPEFRENFADGLIGLEKSGMRKGTPEYEAAKEMHDHINAATGIKSEDEIASEVWMRGLSESTEIGNKLYLKMSGNTTILGQAKALGFQLNLGMLNPSQLMVQGSGMAVTFGAHPVAFTRAFPKIMEGTLRDLHAIPSPKGTVHDLWRASGFKESIDNQADMGRTMMSSKPGEIANVFFNQGELLNRRAAFYTSYETAKSKLGRELTKEDLPGIIEDANRLTLNFSSINKAKWQNGFLGLLTQFQQVMEKSFNQIYLPLLKPGHKSPLTKSEQVGAAAVQMMLFGLAGVPFGNWAIEMMDKHAADAGMSPEDAAVWKNGLSGMMPIKNNFTGRMAMGQLTGNFYTKLAAGQMRLTGSMLENLRKGALGVFGTTVARAYEGAEGIAVAMESGDVNFILQEVQKTAMQMPASLRNLYILQQYRNTLELSSSRGRPLSNIELNNVEQTFLALGFPPQEIEDAFNAMDWLKVQEDYIKESADFVMQAWQSGVDVLNPSEWYEGGAMFKMLASSTPAQRAEIQRRVEKKLLKGNDNLVERIGELTGEKMWLQNTTNPVINEALKDGQLR